MRRLLAFFLILLLLAAPCAAQGTEDVPEAADLAQLMAQFRETYGLNEDNFSLCYRDTVTGQEYRFNDTKFMAAASTFKLPLNLYYYELEQDGEITADTYVGGLRLADAHYESLVWSNNDVSIAMLYRLGSFRAYKEAMRKYFTMDESRIDAAYYVDNNYCTAMMLDALQYLYDRRDRFPEMLDLMTQAQPGEYFDKYAGDWEVAHKYGFFADDEKGVTAVNDVGIVFTPRPFLLAVYTANVYDGAEVTAQACRWLAAYSLRQYEAAEAARLAAEAETKKQADPPPAPPAPEAPPPAEPASAPEPAQDQTPQKAEETPEETYRASLWWMILIAAVIFLAADLGVLFLMRRGGPDAWMERRAEKRAKKRK